MGYLDTGGGTMALTDTALKALRPKEKPYTLADRNSGLELWDSLSKNMTAYFGS